MRAVLSVWGAILGLPGGYVLSDILIRANSKTYDVTGLTKNLSGFSLIMGLVVSTIIFCIADLLCYGFVRTKEAGTLLAGNNIQNRFSAALKTADKISRIVPVNKRLSLRIALRKPLSVLLLFVSVMLFNVCIILLSMLGHHIKYIRKLLVDVYLPVLWIVFVITLAPSIILARTIQNSLSISTNDYMPFGINLLVIIIAFGLINLIYYGVQAAFSLRIKRIIAKGEIADIVYTE